MNKEIVLVIAFVTMLSLASIAGITHASTASNEKETSQVPTSQTVTLNNTASHPNATWVDPTNGTWIDQIKKALYSDYFKQYLANLSTTQKTQPQYPSGGPDWPTLYVHALYPYGSPSPRGITDPQNILGYSDGQYTRFHTEVWRPKPDGDEAIIAVIMEAAVDGQIWLDGYTGQYPTSDVFVFGTNNPNGNWMCIGGARFDSHQPQSVFVGTATSGYAYISLCAYASKDPPGTEQNDAYVDSITIIHDNGGESGPFISVSATADVAITPPVENYGSTMIYWQCADDYGVYYCHITDVYIDSVWHDPNEFGSINVGSITFNDYLSHSVEVDSIPNTYPVTFNIYAHNDNFGNTLVTSRTENHVAWEEVGGPHYSHGSDLNGGGPENYYVDTTINDPWGWGTDYFSWAIAYNWGGGSESYYYGIPLSISTFTWGNTVDIYYNWQPSGNCHTVTFQYGDDSGYNAGQSEIAIDGNWGYYMDYYGIQYSLHEGWHELWIPSQIIYWTIDSVYQDGNQIAGSVTDIWFYVGSDSTISCWYTL